MTDVSAHDPTPLEVQLGRRRFLGCAALFGVAGPLLVACSGSEDSSGSSGTADPGSGSSSSGNTGSDGSDGSGAGTDDVLVAAADVPVGGGVVLTDIVVAVTQPTEGEFKAFDAHCTHQGRTLGEPNAEGIMTCPLHGSQFTVEGENVVGPNGGGAGTTANLTEIAVKVKGGNVVRA